MHMHMHTHQLIDRYKYAYVFECKFGLIQQASQPDGQLKSLTLLVPGPGPPPSLNSCRCQGGRGLPKSLTLPVPGKARSA